MKGGSSPAGVPHGAPSGAVGPSAAEAAYRALGVERDLERVIDGMIARVRRFMAVPDDVSDPIVDEELAALRQRLCAFVPEYRARYWGALAARLPERALASIAEGGAVALDRREAAGLEAVGRQMARELERLRERMQQIPLYGSEDP